MNASNQKMSIFGVGPLWVLITFFYVLSLYFISSFFGASKFIINISDKIIYAISFALLLMGIPFWIISVITLAKGFPKDKLIKEGVYSIVRNPLYSSILCFIVPGFIILTKSWLYLTIPIFMYFVFKILIKKEEVYLENKFGQEYLNYKKDVNLIIPFIKL